MNQTEMILDIQKLLSQERENIKEDEWYAHAQDLINKLKLNAIEVDVPHEIWHYLSDYDIRRKDIEYANKQIDHIHDLISSMEKA